MFIREQRSCTIEFPGFRIAYGNLRCGSRGWVGVLTSSKDAFREDARFRVLRLIEADGNLTQRQIASKLGVSLGAVNYCLKGLVEKGSIKIRNFRASNFKWRYAYVLTPTGVSEKTKLTARYLQRRRREYEALREELEVLTGKLMRDGV